MKAAPPPLLTALIHLAALTLRAAHSVLAALTHKAALALRAACTDSRVGAHRRFGPHGVSHSRHRPSSRGPARIGRPG